MLSDVGDALVDGVVRALEVVHGLIGRAGLFTRICVTTAANINDNIRNTNKIDDNINKTNNNVDDRINNHNNNNTNTNVDNHINNNINNNTDNIIKAAYNHTYNNTQAFLEEDDAPSFSKAYLVHSCICNSYRQAHGQEHCNAWKGEHLLLRMDIA
jgi:predicted RND superfamily exporter protein